MSRVIDFDKPLSDEDKRWLHERSLDWRIEENERKFGQSDTHAEGTPINMKAVLADAGVEVPEAPATPIYVGEQGPGTEGFRDHPLTGVVVASDEDEDAEEAHARHAQAAHHSTCSHHGVASCPSPVSPSRAGKSA